MEAFETVAGLPEDAARRLIGPRADYYLARWRAIPVSGLAVGFNWPAFFFGPIWMLYRRMYRTFAIAIGAIALVVALEILAASLLHVVELSRLITRALDLTLGLLFGSYGSYWYSLEVRRRYERFRSHDGSADADLDRAGGVSWGAAVLAVTLIVALFVVSVTLQSRVQ